MIKQVNTLFSGNKVLLNEFNSFLPGIASAPSESTQMASSKSKEKYVLCVYSQF